MFCDETCEQWTDEKLGREIDRLHEYSIQAMRRRNALVDLWNKRNPEPPKVSLLGRVMARFGGSARPKS